MKYFTLRRTNIVAFFFCIALLAIAYYFQYVQLLEPCPLCLMQRFLVLILAMLFLLGIVLRKKTYIFMQNTLVILAAIAAMGFAGRKVWLEQNPSDSLLSCTPGLEYMFENLPFQQTVNLLLQGGGDCAQVDWTFLGLSMSAWTFLFFLGFALLGFINIFRSLKQKRLTK